MSATKTKSSAGKNVLIFFIVFIILEMLIIFGVGKVFKNKDVTPSIAGYSLYLMDSDAMGDVVPEGSLVIAANGTPSVEKINSAVVCENVDKIGTSVFWLTDITSKGETVDGVTYTVVQAKDTTKFYEIKSSNIVGIASNYYLTAGKVITFVTSTFGMIVCAVVPLFLLVLIEIIIAIATHEPADDDDEEEEEEEEKESDVQLSDFLFGGQNEGEQIAKHIKKMDAEMAGGTARKKAEKAAAEEYTPKPAAEPAPKAAPAEIPEPVVNDEPVNRSYYERASQLLDDATNETVSRPAQRPVRRRPRPQSQTSSKTASASLEDLMKLMDEEQKKLNDQIK